MINKTITTVYVFRGIEEIVAEQKILWYDGPGLSPCMSLEGGWTEKSISNRELPPTSLLILYHSAPNSSSSSHTSFWVPKKYYSFRIHSSSFCVEYCPPSFT